MNPGEGSLLATALRGLWPLALAALAGCASDDPVGPVPVDGCERVALAPSRVSVAAWDAAGRRIAVVSTHDGQGAPAPGLYVVDLRSGHGERVVDGAGLGAVSSPDWPPVADRLAVVRGVDVWILDLATRAWEQVTDGTRTCSFARCSPDGGWIYFVRDRGPFESDFMGGLYVADTRLRLIRAAMLRDTVPVWPLGPVAFSPDGEWLAYPGAVPGPTPDDAESVELFAVRRDGTQRRRLTGLGGDLSDVRWSADGRRLHFSLLPPECIAAGASVRHTWGIDVAGGRADRERLDHGDPYVAGGLQGALDRTHRRMAFPGRDPSLGVGVLMEMDLATGERRRLF